jgi:hypothetical protein
VGLASLTHATKKEIVADVALDVNIQATGTPIFGVRLSPVKRGGINVLLTMSPMVPGDNCKQLNVLIMCNIVCRINSDKATAKMPKSVQLEGSLDAENKDILLQH